MSADGRNIKVEALNERRLAAVKLRLSGASIAEVAAQTGLSQPTVIAAVKAYQGGGWGAVPVAPRGRGVKKPPVSQSVASSNIKYFSSPAPYTYERSRAPIIDLPVSVERPTTLTHLQRL